MQNFTRNLLTEWRKLALPFSDSKILVAVSGGADSCSLAFALANLVKRKKLAIQFIIAHFNHNLRGVASESDAQFVEKFANELNFEFVTSTAMNDAISKKGNIEQSARIARYKFLAETAALTNSCAVLTGHTKNDQAETFLLNLIRGSGLDGLSAMKATRKLDKRNEFLLVRPLLNWAKREDTETFAAKNKIKFKQDSMNEDLNYKRVRIRKELLPILKKFNPKIVETLANTSNILREENYLINELLSYDEESQILIKADDLKIDEVRTLSSAMLYKVLRGWLLSKRGNLTGLESNHFEAIETLIHSRKSGKVVELPKLQRIVKEDGKLNFQRVEVEK